MNNDKPEKKRLHRIKPSDIPSGPELLALAIQIWGEPELSQRRFFKHHMPTIYMLHHQKKFTFKLITELLRTVGLRLSESSVRVYFYEFIQKHENEYIQQLEEQGRLFDDVRKQNAVEDKVV